MLFLLGIPFIVLAVIWFFTRKKDKLDRELSFLFFGLISLVVGIFIAWGVGSYITPNEAEWVSVSTDKLVAIRDGGQTEGSFFLGTGGIEGVMYVHYFKENGDGGYKYGKTKLETATIYEDSPGDATMVVKEQCEQDSPNNWLGFGIGQCSYQITEFHVPKGTVDKNYRLDLQ